MKKVGIVFFLTVVLFLQVFSFGYAFENIRSMDVQSAAMGFVSDDMHHYQDGKFFSIDSVYSELFDLGLTYNAHKIKLFSPRADFVLGIASLLDKDIVDDLGYSEKGAFVQLDYKVMDTLKVGACVEHEKYLLQEENIGNGWRNTVRIQTGPYACKLGNYEVGVSTGNIVRKFSSGREEKRAVDTELYFRLDNNSTLFAMSINKNEIHFGTEYSLSNNIILRAGLNGKEPTFGLGVKLNRLKLNYAYWLSEAGATQLFGSSYSF